MTGTEYLVDNIALFIKHYIYLFQCHIWTCAAAWGPAAVWSEERQSRKTFTDVSGTLIYPSFCVPLQVCVRADLRRNNEEDYASSIAAYLDLIRWKSKSRVKNTATFVFTHNSPPRNVSGNVRCMCEEGLEAKLGRETEQQQSVSILPTRLLIRRANSNMVCSSGFPCKHSAHKTFFRDTLCIDTLWDFPVNLIQRENVSCMEIGCQLFTSPYSRFNSRNVDVSVCQQRHKEIS